MKILQAEQIRELDAYTIKNEPISSIDLMERAALTFIYWFTDRFPDVDQRVHIICGPGNNGGDGLAAARLLHQRFYEVTVYRCRITDHVSDDFAANLERLPGRGDVPVIDIEKDGDLPEIAPGGIVIDAVFGSGLNRPVEGFWAELLRHLNQLPVTRVAIDVPSGLFADQHSTGAVFHAHHTFSFQMPKLAFLFAENQEAAGEWTVGDIGLSREFIERTETPYFLTEEAMVRRMLHHRKKFDHKGVFGHALLIMGSYGKVGAAILAARAALRSGAGLVSVHAPRCAYEILQISVPEAMVSIDRHKFYLSEIPDLESYQAVGVGCGLDKRKTTRDALLELLDKAEQPLVIDADGLNLIGETEGALRKIPKGSILTPHPKEFERLFGKTGNNFEENERQRAMAEELGIYIVLKGGVTCVATPEGDCYFNPTGNPGMATGGSGDVLTGIITGLVAQGYSSLEASVLGVYVHGLAGDLAAADLEHESLVAGDLIAYLGKAFHHLKTNG